MDNSGRINFGVRAQNETVRTITSPLTYRNNQWHMVTATMGSAGMTLNVDGVQVGSRTDTTQGEEYIGNWRLGGDRFTVNRQPAWPNVPSATNGNFVGSVDEVAVYPTALTASQILDPVPGRNGRAAAQLAADGELHRPRLRV